MVTRENTQSRVCEVVVRLASCMNCPVATNSNQLWFDGALDAWPVTSKRRGLIFICWGQISDLRMALCLVGCVMANQTSHCQHIQCRCWVDDGALFCQQVFRIFIAPAVNIRNTCWQNKAPSSTQHRH